MDRKLYIAYGSNLSVEQMDYRCPDATIVGTATLSDWKLVFRTHADIEPCKGSSVPVLVWSITEADERNLDRYEGYPNYYIKRSVPVTLSGTGRTVLAMVYVMAQGRKAAIPPAKYYYDTIAEGYDRFGFDKAILENTNECELIRFIVLKKLYDCVSRYGKDLEFVRSLISKQFLLRMNRNEYKMIGYVLSGGG